MTLKDNEVLQPVSSWIVSMKGSLKNDCKV